MLKEFPATTKLVLIRLKFSFRVTYLTFMCPTMFQLNKLKILNIILSLAVLNKEVHEI